MFWRERVKKRGRSFQHDNNYLAPWREKQKVVLEIQIPICFIKLRVRLAEQKQEAVLIIPFFLPPSLFPINWCGNFVTS